MAYRSAFEGNGTLTAGADAQVVAARVARNGIIISVMGASTDKVNFTFEESNGVAPTATATTGIQLTGGGSLSLVGADCFQGAIRCFSATTPTVGWVEF